MLLKCCSQDTREFRKLSSGQRTGKGQFLLQSKRKAMPKGCSNYCTIALISHASKVMLKILQARLQQHMNFQIFKQDLEKAGEPEVNCLHPFDHWKNKRAPGKYLLLLYWLCQSLWLCGSHKLWKILQEMGIPDHLTYLLRNLCAGQETKFRTGHGRKDWFQVGKGVYHGCILSPCLFNLYAEYIM